MTDLLKKHGTEGLQKHLVIFASSTHRPVWMASLARCALLMGGQKTENEECAKWLIELYSDYFSLSGKYGNPVVYEYSEAVAMAIMALAERKKDGN